MSKTSKKMISVFLAVLMLVACFTPAVSAEGADAPHDCEYSPTVIVPGLFQSPTHLFDDNGEWARRSDGEYYAHPFFVDSTSEIIKTALKKLLFPLLCTVFTQSDRNGRLAKAIAETVGDVLLDKIKSDSNGNTVYNVDAEHYYYSFAEYTDSDKGHVLSSVPVEQYMDIAGEDHLYYFCYNSLGNIDKITDELYNFIQFVKEETGHDRVNIVPVSQGGTICTNLLEYYPEVMDDLDRIVYVVPALGGTELVNDIFKNGLNTDDEAIYGYMLPALFGEDTGTLLSLVLRLLPKEVVKNCMDVAIESVMQNYVKNSTCLWAFTIEDDYPALAEKYLSGEENAVIRAQADKYQVARVNRYANILKAKEKGVEVFDIVNYNVSLYPVSGAWDEVNADGMIHIASEGMGTYAIGVDKTLPEGYVQQGNSYATCSDPENHNHIDPYNLIDASTSLLPDQTFYYYKGNHAMTGHDDSILNLVAQLLTDKSFTDVYSRPDEYPQFNNARETQSFRRALAKAKEILPELSGEDAAALSKVIEQADTMLSHTAVDIEETEKAMNDFYEVYNRIMNVSDGQSFFTKVFYKTVKSINNRVQERYGYNSFSGK